ncbi:hypothetical protein NW762_013779 [Fusarium torreyae]|uniref:Uncharacterized protein n=1 Tax=Fusarium torreyae TaxID=1237075 RepID=A0A9W8RLM5_9HYPO|nr:hypothetical protein NW762_013779 [Fusarium torreyae]
MSFGFGVGDFIKILELGIEARKRFVDAPSQYDDISSALKNFSNIVQDIDVLLWGCEPEPEQKASLQHIKDDSSSLLKDLLVKLDETQDIGASSTGKSGRVRKAWKRITWDPAEIATFRSRLSLNLEMLNAIERQLSR